MLIRWTQQAVLPLMRATAASQKSLLVWISLENMHWFLTHQIYEKTIWFLAEWILTGAHCMATVPRVRFSLTVCPRSSDPFYKVSYYNKMGHYFLDTQYKQPEMCSKKSNNTVFRLYCTRSIQEFFSFVSI